MKINKNKNLKNIAIFCGSMYRAGAEHVSLYLAKGLRNYGYNTEIITVSQRDKEYDVPKEIKRYVLNASNEKEFLPKTIGRLRKILIKDCIDMLLIITTPLCLYAMPAICGLNIKVLVSERNDPTHFEGKKTTQFFSELLMKKADAFVFQTHDAKRYFDKRLKGKGTVIYNPLFTQNLPTTYCGSREKKIVAVGRLEKQKNMTLLIEAFSECTQINQEYELIIYGEGSLRNELVELIKKNHMEEKIKLPGNVTDVFEKIRKASLFVLPSNFEGMPNALIEALAMGLPCISTKCPIGGPAELIENGVNGILIPVNDKECLKKEMLQLLFSTKKLRELSRNAVKIREYLSADIILEKWANYIERFM